MNQKESIISVGERELALVRAREGDAEALNVLFESCRRRLYGQALRILARPQDAEDAVQEAMLAAFRHLHRFQGRGDFLTWATRIVINDALQHIRKNRAKPTVPWDQIDDQFEGEFRECVRDLQPTPEERLQSVEHWEILEEALHKLPVGFRRAIQLCKFSDCSLKEAARLLGLPVGTLKARLHRGRQALMVHVKRETRVRIKPAASKQRLQLRPASKGSLCAA